MTLHGTGRRLRMLAAVCTKLLCLPLPSLAQDFTIGVIAGLTDAGATNPRITTNSDHWIFHVIPSTAVMAQQLVETPTREFGAAPQMS